jgi:glycerate 2-kinase
MSRSTRIIESSESPKSRARVVACPGPLKGVLGAAEAARALADGFGRAGVGVDQVPLADGGEGTAAALQAAFGGEWRSALVSDPFGRPVEARFVLLPDGRAVLEAAEAIGLRRLAPEELDPLRASSRGFGELIAAALEAGATGLVLGLGDTATVDGGAGLRQVVERLAVPTAVACDVTNPLLGERGAAHVFAPQKGASAEMVEALEARMAALEDLRPFAALPGAGAAGGLGAALAAMGALLVPGAELIAAAAGLPDRLAGALLAVTGEGAVDRTSLEGKATGVVARLCAEHRIRCVIFGGRVEEDVPGAETIALSGDPARARTDLADLGERLGRAV